MKPTFECLTTDEGTSPFFILTHCGHFYPKSIQKSTTVVNFHGTGINIWAGFGMVGITKKDKHLGWSWATFEAGFRGQKKNK